MEPRGNILAPEQWHQAGMSVRWLAVRAAPDKIGYKGAVKRSFRATGQKGLSLQCKEMSNLAAGRT